MKTRVFTIFDQGVYPRFSLKFGKFFHNKILLGHRHMSAGNVECKPGSVRRKNALSGNFK